MANADEPRGAWPIRHLTGGTIRLMEFEIASGYNTNIFAGDFVKLVGGGDIELASAGNRLLGVFAGVEWTATDGEKKFSRYWPASTATLGSVNAKAKVYADPNIVFGVQADGSVVQADIGQLADFIATHSGSTTTGRGAEELNSSTGTGPANLQILGKIDDPDNAWGANVNLEVRIYEHEFNEHIDADGTPGV